MSPDGVTALIPLCSSDRSVRAYAVIDAADADFISQWHWCLTDGYAVRNTRVGGHRAMLGMHRAVLGLQHGDGVEGDHINRDTLDNRRENLRPITHNGNKQNRSKYGGRSSYRGVTWSTQAQRWLARVKVNGRTHHLGTFTDEVEAAEAARLGRARLMPYAVD